MTRPAAPPIESVSARRFADDDRCRFRPSTRPGLRVVARLTGRCTFRCQHCLAAAPGNLRSLDLPVTAWKTILGELREVGANKVLLTGGEPLLFDGLVEVTSHVAGMGVSSDLNSSLWHLTKSLASELAGAGLTEASVGIEGPEGVHDALLGRARARARLFAGIEMLREAGIPVDGSMYVTPANRLHVRTTIQDAARLGLGSFTVSRMLPVGHGMRYAGPRVPEADLAALHHELAEARAGSYGIPVRCTGLLGAPRRADCRQGEAIIGIRADGALTPCVLSRDEIPGLPRPQDVGLARAVEAMRIGLSRALPSFCYGGP